MVDIYFDVDQHKYTDSLGNAYTSVTTLINQYYEHFDAPKMAKVCAKIGRNPKHRSYKKYKGKSEQDLIKLWDKTRDDACALGTNKHDALEQRIKGSNGYFRLCAHKLKTNQLYTYHHIQDPTTDHGNVDINSIKFKQIKEMYPLIHRRLLSYINAGWKVYSEVCVYNRDYLISGLIDILLVKGKTFRILDWKTNKADIRFDSGYFVKDENYKATKEFRATNKFMYYPINHLTDSTGIHYSLQLSLYAFLLESAGYKYDGGEICHIRHEDYTEGMPEVIKHPYLLGLNKTDLVPVIDLRGDVEKMVSHFINNKQLNLRVQ